MKLLTRPLVSLAALYVLRMVGLFMLLPVLALYAQQFSDHTAVKVGLAIGIYGLTQALLQIPLGLLSDKIGRKPIVLFGLALFAFGSLFAAYATTLTGVIIGRALQGAGVISSAVLAWVADITPYESRAPAMGVIGMAIGFSFILSLIAGPLLTPWLGVDGLFKVIAGLGMLGLFWVLLALPAPESVVDAEAETVVSDLKDVLQNGQLIRLDAGIFCLHALMTALFVVVPILLKHHFNIATPYHAVLYGGVLLLSILFMLPAVIIAEKKQKLRFMFLIAVITLAVAQAVLALFYSHFWVFAGALCLFFIAFNILEALLPAWISKVAPPGHKGSAMGVYATSQFLGAFVGASLAGFLQQHFTLNTVFAAGALLAGLWWLLALGLQSPRPLKRFAFPLRSLTTANFTHCVKFFAATLDPAVKPRDDGVRNNTINGPRLASLENKTPIDAVALQTALLEQNGVVKVTIDVAAAMVYLQGDTHLKTEVVREVIEKINTPRAQ